MGELSAPVDAFGDLRVLLVEDDDLMRVSLEDRMRLDGIPVSSVTGVDQARRRMDKGDIDLVITDVRLPDGSGRDLFEHVSTRHPGVGVVVITAFGSVADAVSLVKAGALDYCTKPFDLGDFVADLKRQLARIAEAGAVVDSGAGGGEEAPHAAVPLGNSGAIRRIERLVARLARTDSPILISGESGVGKEVVARFIHQRSVRCEGPWVCVNCAAIPESLFESEFFGHERGAFTGAERRHIGRFEQADSGTIFLDEIAEIPPEVQVKLLRVLQEKQIERLGGESSIALDVRVIAATQIDLAKAISRGTFRADLYWRINVIHIPVPPLRERPEDILYLARQFIARHSAGGDQAALMLSAEAEGCLQSMKYPGNVRELRNILERAAAICDGDRIEPRHLMPIDFGDQPTFPENAFSLRQAVEETERAAILNALETQHWAIGRAAEMLSISRKNLWQKMKRYGIQSASRS